MNGGYRIHEVNPYYTQARSEHKELHAAIERIHATLDATRDVDASVRSIEKATVLIAVLRDRLAQHFEQEEQGGYLEEAVVRVPQLASQALQLQRQHAEFLQAAGAMLEHARSTEAAPLVWANLKTDYVLFAKKLNAHEAAENALLARAFNEDTGVDS